MAFEITPVTPQPLTPDDLPPAFIQWQAEGVDQGAPNVQIVNFVGANIEATRGTGENRNVITVRLIPPVIEVVSVDYTEANDTLVASTFPGDVIFLGIPLPATVGAITMDDSSRYHHTVVNQSDMATVSDAETLFGAPVMHVPASPTGGFAVELPDAFARLAARTFTMEFFLDLTDDTHYQLAYSDGAGKVGFLFGDLAVSKKWSVWLGFDGFSDWLLKINTTVDFAHGTGFHFLQLIRDNSLLPGPNVLLTRDGAIIGSGTLAAGVSIERSGFLGAGGIMQVAQNNGAFGAAHFASNMRLTGDYAWPIAVPTEPFPIP